MPEKKKSTSTKHSSPLSAFEVSDVKKTKIPESGKQRSPLLIAGIIVTVIIVIGIGLYYYLQYQHEQKLLKNPVLASEIIQESVVSRVGKLTQLPTDEKPAIAKVTDITKLKNQPFFQNAKNGDFVLVYSKDKRIILYDPNSNKIIQSVTYQANSSQVQGASSAPSQPITVAIYNGTTIAGLAKKTQAFLEQKLNNIDIISETNAARQDYTQTLVVDLTGNNSAVSSQLATLLGATVASLPNGEAKPGNTDLLVILGSK
jgi:hypothetical protein